MLVGIMVLIPLLFTEALPKAQLMTVSWWRRRHRRRHRHRQPRWSRSCKIQTNMINGQLRTPTKIPKKIEIIKEDDAPPQMAGVWAESRAASREARWAA